MRKDKKIITETNRIISAISSKIEDNIDKDIIGKEIEVVYDEILPDLFVKIPMTDEVMERYDINIPKKYNIEYVLYDIYTEYIREVYIQFPNGIKKIFNIGYIEEQVDNEFYCCTWQEPILVLDFNGLPLEVKVLDLIKQGARVFIKKYKMKERVYGQDR